MELIIYWQDPKKARTILTNVKNFDTQFGVLSVEFANGKTFDELMSLISYISVTK